MKVSQSIFSNFEATLADCYVQFVLYSQCLCSLLSQSQPKRTPHSCQFRVSVLHT